MADLRSQQIKDRFQSLLTTSEVTSDPTTGTLQNGKGTAFTALTVAGVAIGTGGITYEDGTWTPTALGQTTPGTATYTRQVGQFTKIGNVVHVTCFVEWSGHTGTGNLVISGLPFLAGGTSVSQIIPGAGFSSNYNFGTSATQIVPFVFGATDFISWRGVLNNAERVIPQVSASGNISATISYRVTI